GAGPGLERDVVRHLVQPAAQGAAVADGTSLSRQHEEGGLEGVLGVVAVAEQPAADAEHHRAVPLHQPAEGQFVALSEEPVEQLAVRGVLAGADETADVEQNGIRVFTGHRRASVGWCNSSIRSRDRRGEYEIFPAGVRRGDAVKKTLTLTLFAGLLAAAAGGAEPVPERLNNWH